MRWNHRKWQHGEVRFWRKPSVGFEWIVSKYEIYIIKTSIFFQIAENWNAIEEKVRSEKSLNFWPHFNLIILIWILLAQSAVRNLTIFLTALFLLSISIFVNLKKWWYFVSINFVFGNNPLKSYWAFPSKSHFSVLSFAMVPSHHLGLKALFYLIWFYFYSLNF